jgi:predicted helicase
MGFARFITDEANAAAEIKRDRPIMVVLGNPPYSVSSANQGEHIEKLMDRYKAAVRDERNIQPLSDDYIKFIRFAHDRIERTGYGVIGMITNHSYLSGLIHRGMREELMKSFDEIYVLNLHGNALMGETAPDGGPDENVFDIRQGVAISLFVKKREGEGLAQVKYADLWGLRDGKYCYLWENDVNTTEWQDLGPVAPYFFFVPKDLDLLSEYERGWSVADIFPVNSTGIKTHRDHFVIDFEEKRLRSRIAEFRDEALSDDEVRERFKLRDTRDWKLIEARVKLQERKDWDKDFNRCLYRPFDIRPIYYSGDVIELSRPEVMRHMLQENIALLTCRQQFDVGFRHVFCSNRLAECCAVSLKSREVTYVFPLYLYKVGEKKQPLKGGGSIVSLMLFESRPGYETRDPNLAPEFIAAVKDKLGLDFVTEGKGDLENTFGPEDILHYAYAVFHSPTYRERYAEFLKIDFPRLPLTSNRELFKALAEKGEELVSLHLMEPPSLNHLITGFPVSGSDVVEKVRYVEQVTEEKKVPTDISLRSVEVSNLRLPLVFEHQTLVEIPPEPEPRPAGRVYINKTQYFEGIEPKVWEFQIGGYQVLHKWLTDRKGRKLTFYDLFHWQKIVVALKETMRLMGEIDELIPSWPIE